MSEQEYKQFFVLRDGNSFNVFFEESALNLFKQNYEASSHFGYDAPIKLIEHSAFQEAQDKIQQLEKMNDEFKSVITRAINQLEMYNFSKDERRVYNADTLLRQSLKDVEGVK